MLRFAVKGSTGNSYEINASRDADNFRMSCTCEAGQNKLYCKHRISLLEGDVGLILSGNEADINQLLRLAAGTSVEKRLRTVKELEAAKAAIETKLKAEKKALAREMTGKS